MFIDTTVLIDLFRYDRDDENLKSILDEIGDESLYISQVQVAEISDYCVMQGENPEETLSLVKEYVNIVPLFEEMCLDGARIKMEMRAGGAGKFSLNDGIILASARSMGHKLLTSDNDFKLAPDAIHLS